MPNLLETMAKRELVPDYYLSCEQSRTLIETLGKASLEAKTALEDVMDQFFVETATWGLNLWEEQVGIETDNSLSQEIRRTAIKQKLVASGNTTAETIQQLAESITGFETQVTVHSDYSFSLRFLGEKNELLDIDIGELYSAVERIKPAHLRFVIPGITWRDLDAVEMLWDYFEYNSITWAEFTTSKFRIYAKE